MKANSKFYCAIPTPILMSLGGSVFAIGNILFLILLLVLIIRTITRWIKHQNVFDNFCKKSLLVILTIIIYAALYFIYLFDNFKYLWSLISLCLVLIANVWIFWFLGERAQKRAQIVYTVILLLAVEFFVYAYKSKIDYYNSAVSNPDPVFYKGTSFLPLGFGDCGSPAWW